jgi:hypothetical protein
MVDIHDVKTGQCYVNRTLVMDMDCWVLIDNNDPPKGLDRVRVSGASMFFCESDIEVPQQDMPVLPPPPDLWMQAF